MNAQEIWSLLHLGVGGVALEDGAALDAGDAEMMLGLFAHDDTSEAGEQGSGRASGRRGLSIGLYIGL